MLRAKIRLIPTTLRNRLFVTYILLVLLPASFAFYYLFHRMEADHLNDVTLRMSGQQQQITRSFEELMGLAYKSSILLNQDESVYAMMRHPEQYDRLDRKKIMESKLFGINNSFVLSDTDLYFRLTDLSGNSYTSYMPLTQLIHSKDYAGQWIKRLADARAVYEWVPDDENDVGTVAGARLLSLYSRFDSLGGDPYGIARISIDYRQWLSKQLAKNATAGQDLIVLNGRGESIFMADGTSLEPSLFRRMADSGEADGYFADAGTGKLITYRYMDTLQWYFISEVPLHEVYRDIYRLRFWFMSAFGVFVCLFAAVIYLVAVRTTRPLSKLQRQMTAAASNKLDIRITPSSGWSGEVLSLTGSFNSMMDDIQLLIRKLKEEERQKQAVRFQVLLMQMNPHFLLNTLNVVKWIARRNQQEQISDICVSLGLLLEAGLDTETDMALIKQELELLRAYVTIQQNRFQNRFEVLYELDATVEYAIVPKFSLQPLVENAIQHGIGPLGRKGLITVRIRADGGMLLMEVEDDGVGMEAARQVPRPRKSSGIGLANLRERLQLLFKTDAEILLLPLEQGTRASVRIPLLISKPYGEGETDVDDLNRGR
ncbi:histidine kinase [Gorillibacterium sp. sgz5001074]|uniref:sensor histidine kinase n=1 Tax=Gorillibacterium sp. sgz5001074 TaxID=3446695 RepID=UPI003F663567